MIHKHFADSTNEQSVATRLRRRRFTVLLEMLRNRTGPISILDIGGTAQYWDMMRGIGLVPIPQVHITLLNLEACAVTQPHFTSLAGDGRAMGQFTDHHFDIVFSNSTIEHVGGFADQERMAQEVRRVGKQYYVQTPNRHFPIEPHFVFPFFHFLPVAARVWLAQRYSLGWYPRMRDYGTALNAVRSIRLLTRSEIQQLFPEATIVEERAYGLVKSFVAYTQTDSLRSSVLPA
jgi:hypothetical protein